MQLPIGMDLALVERPQWTCDDCSQDPRARIVEPPTTHSDRTSSAVRPTSTGEPLLPQKSHTRLHRWFYRLPMPRATARPHALLATLALITGLLSAATLSLSAPPASAAASPPGLPNVLDGRVLAFAQMGTRIVVGGSFTKFKLPNGTTVTQPRLFAYDFATGTYDPTFRPVVDNEVDALVANADGSGVYLGGAFTHVNAVARGRIAHLTAGGLLDTAFNPDANSRVQTLALTGSRLFLGGQFSKLGATARSGLAELNSVTGSVSAGFNLSLSGSVGVAGFTGVHSLRISPDGQRLLVAHTFRQLGAFERIGVAIIDINTANATVDPWYTTLWKDALASSGGVCRITDAAWGPDGTWFVATNTGGDLPPTNDSVQRFNLNAPLPASPAWVTRQFDSAYAVDVDGNGSIYVGGHFRYTEAPGSTDPWPGDSHENYGYAAETGGARVLGTQVVYREQIGALNPVDGKALNWWSSADGQRGVDVLKVVGNRLLIGQDGLHVDGQPTGRHGMAALFGAAYDTTVPHTTVASPLIGANLSVGAVTVSGTSTAPKGVKKVQVEIKDNKALTWLHTDGSWGTFYAFNATVSSPNAITTAWTLALSMPTAGNYQILAKTVDTTGAGEPVKVTLPFFINDFGNAPPHIDWISPYEGQQDFTTNTVTFTGRASDPDGVAAVNVSFYTAAAGGFLNHDGSIGDYDSFVATLAQPGAVTTTFSVTVTLPNGKYEATAKSADLKGASDPRGADLGVQVAVGNPPPSTTVTSPQFYDFVNGPFTITGTASDDTSVQQVYVHAIETRFGTGPQVGGGFGYSGYNLATLDHPGAATTGWSINIPALPYGTYVIQAYAVDGNNLGTATSDRPTVVVLDWPAGATSEPQTTLDTSTDTRYTDLNPTFTGTASYLPGLAHVYLTFGNVTRQWWLQADGTSGLLPAYFEATLTPTGPGTYTWALTKPLPSAASWLVDAVAVGTDGNVDSSSDGSRGDFLIFPGDADPTIQLNSPLDGATISGTGGVISVGGRAFDDVGVSGVQVMIASPDGSQGLKADGTVGTPEWVTAFVTNPGGLFSNWNFSSSPIPAGTWKVSARAVDSVGKATLAYPTVTVTLTAH